MASIRESVDLQTFYRLAAARMALGGLAIVARAGDTVCGDTLAFDTTIDAHAEVVPDGALPYIPGKHNENLVAFLSRTPYVGADVPVVVIDTAARRARGWRGGRSFR